MALVSDGMKQFIKLLWKTGKFSIATIAKITNVGITEVKGILGM